MKVRTLVPFLLLCAACGEDEKAANGPADSGSADGSSLADSSDGSGDASGSGEADGSADMNGGPTNYCIREAETSCGSSVSSP